MKQENQVQKAKQETQIQKASFAVPQELKTNVSGSGLSTLIPFTAFASSGKIKVRDSDGNLTEVAVLEGTIINDFGTTLLRRAAAYPPNQEVLSKPMESWSEHDKEIIAMAYGRSTGNIDSRFFGSKQLQKNLQRRTNIIILTTSGKLIRIVSGSSLNTRFKRYAQALALSSNDAIVVKTKISPIVLKNEKGQEYTSFNFEYQANIDKEYFDVKILPVAKLISEIMKDTISYYESLPKVWGADQSIEETGTIHDVTADVISDEEIPF